MSCPCVLHSGISSIKHNILICRISFHVFWYRQTGYRECIIVLNFFSIFCNVAQCITIICFFDFHGYTADHRQRASVKRSKSALIAFYEIFDCLFQFGSAHLGAVSRKTIWHDHVSRHFFCIAGFQHVSRKTVSGCNQHIRSINVTQSVCHNRICRVPAAAMKAVGIRFL